MIWKKKKPCICGFTKAENRRGTRLIKEVEERMRRRVKITILKTSGICIALVLAGQLCHAGTIQNEIVRGAIAEIGAGEVGKNNCGPDIKKYMLGAEGQSWCAGFVSYVINRCEVRELGYNLSAKAIYNKGKARGWETADPRPGDLICFWRESRGSWKGHVGIITEVKDNYVISIEGNRGAYPARVKRIRYKKNNMPKLLGYIRIGGEQHKR